MPEKGPQGKLPDFRIISEQELYQKYLEKDLKPRNRERVVVLMNMIETADGITTIIGPDGKGSEQGIGHTVDQNLMRHLRFHADATLNGSSTLRLSGSDSTIDEQKHPNLIAKRRELGKSDNPIACVITSKANPEEFDEKVLEGDFFPG